VGSRWSTQSAAGFDATAVTARLCAEVLKTVDHVGLNVKANILIGFPEERKTDVRQTLRFLLR
jgi:radical SAM superfamily enzyme